MTAKEMSDLVERGGWVQTESGPVSFSPDDVVYLDPDDDASWDWDNVFRFQNAVSAYTMQEALAWQTSSTSHPRSLPD